MERAAPGRQAARSSFASPAPHPAMPAEAPRPRRRSSVSLLLAFLLPSLAFPIACAGPADGAGRGETLIGFLSRQPDRVFTGPAYSQRGQAIRHLHVSEQEFGQTGFRDPQVRYQPHLDGRDVEIRLAHDYLIVEGRIFAYADARAFDGGTFAPRHPMFADLHVAPRRGDRPPCSASKATQAMPAPMTAICPCSCWSSRCRQMPGCIASLAGSPRARRWPPPRRKPGRAFQPSACCVIRMDVPSARAWTGIASTAGVSSRRGTGSSRHSRSRTTHPT